LSHHNTVFSQLLKMIPRHEFETLANQHHQGRKLRKMTRWSQFISMALAQLSGRSSLRDVVSNLSAQTSKLYHLGSAPVSRSSLTRNKPTRCTRRYSPSCFLVARDSRLATAFVLKTNSIHWMHRLSTSVLASFPGPSFVPPKAQSNCTSPWIMTDCYPPL